MPKLFQVLLSSKNVYKIECNLCDKKYDGEKGLKLHYKYSHGMDIKKIEENSNDFCLCPLCAKNVIHCKCSIAKKNKL